jgi:hypothetical protein
MNFAVRQILRPGVWHQDNVDVAILAKFVSEQFRDWPSRQVRIRGQKCLWLAVASSLEANQNRLLSSLFSRHRVNRHAVRISRHRFVFAVPAALRVSQ